MLNLSTKRVNISEAGLIEDRQVIGMTLYPVLTLLIDVWIESVRWLDSPGECQRLIRES